MKMNQFNSRSEVLAVLLMKIEILYDGTSWQSVKFTGVLVELNALSVLSSWTP
jgi:hypothetical protein